MGFRRTRRTPLATIGLIAAVGAGLTACSDQPEGDAAGADGVTTVTFAASTFGDPGLGPQLEALVDEFNASQDDIRVAPAAVPYPTFGQTVLTQMGSGRGPDLVRFDMPEFAAASDAGLITPIDDLVETDGYDLHRAAGPVHVQRRHPVRHRSSRRRTTRCSTTPTSSRGAEDLRGVLDDRQVVTTKGETYGLAFRQTAGRGERRLAGHLQLRLRLRRRSGRTARS